MCIFDIIKKLENIKHNYLIYALEKYTDQLTDDVIKKREDDIKKKTADDIKKRELERAMQDEFAKSGVKKPDDEVKKPDDEVKKTADEVKKTADEVKKPTNEIKKPTNEVKKFENNIMDSLKWVFISMGILIFLIFVGCLIYWGLYGGNNDEDNTITIENKYIAPTNQVNKYIAPTNQGNQYIAPTNQGNQYIAPTNQVNQYIAPTNQVNNANQYIAPTNQGNQYIAPTNQVNNASKYVEPTNIEDKEGSIFSFLSPFSKKEKTSEIEAISKTKAQLDAEEYLESIKQSRTKQQLNNSTVSAVLESKSNLQSKTKAQLDAEEYLETIKQSRTKQQLDTNKIDEDELPKLLSSSIKDDNNVGIQKV